MACPRHSPTPGPRVLGVALTALAVGLGGCDTAETRSAPETDAPGMEAPAAEAGEMEPAAPVLEAGTEVAFRIDETVSTESHEAGETFTASVAQDVPAGDGTVVLPAGTPARWEITEVGETEEGETVLAFRLASIEVDGQERPLTATVTSTDLEVDEQDSNTETAAKVAIGTAAGAMVGQILGSDTESTLKGAAAGAAMGTVVALSTRGGSARMEEGSLITVQLEEPLTTG